MSRLSQSEIEQMIQRAQPTNRDLVRRDINQAVSSPRATLTLRFKSYIYPNGASKQLLYLEGTVACSYRGNQYNIPIEIWLQQDHPNVPPIAFVRPTPDMYLSPQSRDVQPDGTVIIPYLRSWRHPQSDLLTLLNAMSEAFGITPPVYAASSGVQRPTPYPSSFPMNSSPYSQNIYPSNLPSYSTPYPTNSGMPMPNVGSSSSSSYPYSSAQQDMDHRQAYRDSIVSAVFGLVRGPFDESVQTGKAELCSLEQIQRDLIEGQQKLDKMINDARNQQVLAQNYKTSLKGKISEAIQASQNTQKAKEDNSILDDALLLPAPVYKQLLQAYAEEHAIQDLLYYLAEGLRRESIGLDTYLKHVRELSRKQFMLRATMHRCRQIAGLSVK